jgi:hypothetical protein
MTNMKRRRFCAAMISSARRQRHIRRKCPKNAATAIRSLAKASSPSTAANHPYRRGADTSGRWHGGE